MQVKKREVLLQAYQLTEEKYINTVDNKTGTIISTQHGNIGDWIIIDPCGYIEVCEQSCFAKKYEQVQIDGNSTLSQIIDLDRTLSDVRPKLSADAKETLRLR